MIIWQKFALLFLLLVCAANTIDCRSNKDSEELFDFSHEDDTKTDYSEEHDRNEISHEENHENSEEEETEKLEVCQKNKADLCKCDKKQINCRHQTRKSNAKDVKVVPLKTAELIMTKGSVLTPKYVYLTGNEIEILDQETTLPNMRKYVEGIDFGFNRIDYIEEKTFDKFEKLRKLHLNHNWLKINRSLDGWITKDLGKTLEILNLAYNSIKKINSGAFNPLHKLQRLILDGNTGIKLTADTFGDGGLIELTTISLDNCGLDDDFDTDVFKNLPKLKYVSLIKNSFTSLPAALKPVKTLHTLDLSENGDISEFKADSFKGFDKLENLYLRDMAAIKTYGNYSLNGLTALVHIDFNSSKSLESFDEDAFGYKQGSTPLKTLKMVKMNNCKLTTLTEKLLPWDQLDAIGMAGNKWNCDENLEWLLKDKSFHLFVGTEIPKCAAPPERNGTALQKVMNEEQGKSSGGVSLFKTIFYMGLTIGLVGTLLTGLLYASKRFNITSVPNVFSRRRPDGAAGFSNLDADIGMENDRVFDEDDNEFEPRPAAV